MDLFDAEGPAPPAPPVVQKKRRGNHLCETCGKFGTCSQDNGHTFYCAAHAPADFFPKDRPNGRIAKPVESGT